MKHFNLGAKLLESIATTKQTELILPYDVAIFWDNFIFTNLTTILICFSDFSTDLSFQKATFLSKNLVIVTKLNSKFTGFQVNSESEFLSGETVENLMFITLYSNY